MHADTENCLDAMDQLFELELNTLMLKKHPHVIETIKRVRIFFFFFKSFSKSILVWVIMDLFLQLRRYIGNISDWKLSEEDTVRYYLLIKNACNPEFKKVFSHKIF